MTFARADNATVVLCPSDLFRPTVHDTHSISINDKSPNGLHHYRNSSCFALQGMGSSISFDVPSRAHWSVFRLASQAKLGPNNSIPSLRGRTATYFRLPLQNCVTNHIAARNKRYLRITAAVRSQIQRLAVPPTTRKNSSHIQ